MDIYKLEKFMDAAPIEWSAIVKCARFSPETLVTMAATTGSSWLLNAGQARILIRKHMKYV